MLFQTINTMNTQVHPCGENKDPADAAHYADGGPSGEADGRHCLTGVADIAAVLGDLAWLSSAVGVRTDSGADVATRLLHVDARGERLVFDRTLSASDEAALFESGDCQYLASVRGAPVSFRAGAPKKVKFKGRLAFEVPFPHHVIYVQRRRHFRAQVPPDCGCSCLLSPGAGVTMRMAIIDLSLSGVRIGETGPGAMPLAVGARLKGVVMDFGPMGKLAVELQVVGRWPGNGVDGELFQYGCAFIAVSGKAESQLQRIVTSLELQCRQAAAA
ncbi:Flagellar brake protein YcgR [compost metagenome]